MTSQGKLLGTRALDLILLPEGLPPTAADPRFGIDATSLPIEAWSELPKMLPLLSAGRVKLAVWSTRRMSSRLILPASNIA